MILLKKLKNNWSITAVLLLAVVTRFGGLTWCFPYTPHPDEWNMARAVTQLSWQDKLNPHFFAYGQFPLYLSYFSAVIYNLIPWIKISFINSQEAIFFLRFWSALAGVGTVYLVYLISKKLTPTSHPRPTFHFSPPLLATLLVALTPGLIQISHFGTTESLLSFFFLLILFLSFKIFEARKLKYFIFLGIVFGLAIGTKISALVFGFPVFITFIIFITVTKFKTFADFLKLFGKYLFALIFALIFTLISSPYLLLAFKESRGTLLYETSVATGQTLVFYTRQFIDTKPILFQLQKILPYALGAPIFILGILGFLVSLISLAPIKKKTQYSLITNYQLLITTLAFLFYFLSQAFLFTKWTRFMSPIFAFFPIFSGLFLGHLRHLRNLRYLSYLAVFFAVIPGIIFSSIYFSPDIRFTASEWIYKNIPAGSQILYDTGNVVDLPISRPNYSITPVSFDFYHLDENPELFPKLLDSLEKSNFIIIPSRRIFANHLRLPRNFPLTTKYYQLLFSGKLGFTEIKIFRPFPQFQVSSFKFQIDDEQSEETFTVFDHPTIRIYKKRTYLTANDYENLFK